MLVLADIVLCFFRGYRAEGGKFEELFLRQIAVSVDRRHFEAQRLTKATLWEILNDLNL
jgi:hypothetical protein